MLYARSSQSSSEIPLVLLHSANYTGRMWDDYISRMPEFNSITVDLPGHGESISHPFVGIEQSSDDVAEVISSLKLGRPVNIVGISFGAYIGMSLMHRHPELVDRAILSGFNIEPIKNSRWTRLIGNIFAPISTTKWFRRNSERALGIPDWSSMSNWREKPPVKTKTIRAVLNAATNYHIPKSELQKINTPLLALAGELEHRSITKSLSVLENNMPNCKAITVPKLGHAWPAQSPELFVSVVRSWIIDQKLY